jgi:hypothetical protein
MRAERKNLTFHDGIVTEILAGKNSTQVEIENGHYERGQGYVKENVTLRLDNPAQAKDLQEGTKVSIVKDAAGKTNLVRDGEWKAGEPIMRKSKNGKEYDIGTTVIMGRCVSARLIEPKEGQDFQPFFAMNVVTNDHVMHRITINNRTPYHEHDIENAMEKFKDYLANDKHDFIPFTGSFVTGNAWKTEEGKYEKNGNTYDTTTRSYNGLDVLGAYQDYEKAPERTSERTITPAYKQEAEEAKTSLDTSVEQEAGEDGFINIPDAIEEEVPFNLD